MLSDSHEKCGGALGLEDIEASTSRNGSNRGPTKRIAIARVAKGEPATTYAAKRVEVGNGVENSSS